MYFSPMTVLFLFLAYEFKRGTMLLIATRMFACAFTRFLDLQRKQESRRRV